MTRFFATAAAVIAAGAVLGFMSPAGHADPAQSVSYLNNSLIRVGVDMADGGKITYVGGARQTVDLVQDAQPSFSSGPFAASGYPGWHAFASGATVIDQSNDGKTIYTKTRAAQEFVGPCECFFEQWVRLKGRAILVHNRLTMFRADATRYPAFPQELPALYSTGRTFHVFTYDGSRPYTGAPLTEITAQAGGFFVPGPTWRATEHWGALVGDDGFGIGLFKPDLVRVAGTPGTRENVPNGFVNGYITSSTNEVLDANQAYDYDYTLVVGTLRQIRSYAYVHRPSARPVYDFRYDRQHWWFQNTTDRGQPSHGALRVLATGDDPQLIGPEAWWRARDVPVIYVRGRWASTQHIAELFWSKPRIGFTGDNAALLAAPNDGLFHTFKIRLAGLDGYNGTITGLRFDPVNTAEPGAEIDIACISWKPCPIDRKTEREIVEGGPVPYLDSFGGDRIDPTFWNEVRGGTGPSTLQAGGRLEITVPGTASVDPLYGSLWEGVMSRCSLRGDFDAQVDYQLLDWPPSNGVHLNFGTNWPQAVGRQNVGGELVFAWFPPSVVNIPFDDPAGSLRLVQRGSTITGYVRHDGEWRSLLTAPSFHSEATLQLSVSAQGNEFAHETVRVAFDNFRVNSGRLVCG